MKEKNGNKEGKGRNKILAITRETIPYVKELRKLPLVRSISACVIMQQLDYWFHRYPDEFYKFLEPCNQAAYKEGDSWREELGISDDEFRTAFDQIGVRYKDKKSFDAAKREGDVFNGKYYCSYTDKISRLTYYYRNHEVVDAALDKMLSAGEVVMTDFADSAEPTSRGLERRVLDADTIDTDYTETTTDNTTEITDRIREGVSPSAQPSSFGSQDLQSKIHSTVGRRLQDECGSPLTDEVTASGSTLAAGGQTPDPFGQVFSDWCEVMECPDAVANIKRRTAVNSRLKEGYKVDDLKLATRGILFSEWHMGKNEAKTVYDDIELVCRDGVQVEKFRQLARANGVGPNDHLKKSDYAKGDAVNVEEKPVLHYTITRTDKNGNEVKEGPYWVYPKKKGAEKMGHCGPEDEGWII